jgi:hypothetical protein
VATFGLLLAAIAIAVTVPGRTAVQASRIAGAAAGDAVELPAGFPIQPMPADLRKRIEDLLAAIEKNNLTKDQTSKAAELWNYFNNINADLTEDALKALAKAMDPSQKGSAQMAAQKMLELADRAQKAADASGVPPELKQALENLGTQLSESAEAEARSASDQSQNASAGSNGKDSQSGNATPSSGQPNLNDAIQFSKDNDAGAGASMMMMSDQMGPMGDPSSGFGGAGNSGKPKNNGKMAAIEQALRRETVEASTDTPGANVISEVRRKTERGQATVGFSHAAPGLSDRSLAEAPPPVPEGRRAAVQTYFTRKQ